METVTKSFIDRAVAVMDKSGAQFKIILPDGTIYISKTPLAENAPRRPKRPHTHPHGAMTNYVRPLVESLLPGDVVVVPFSDFNKESLRGVVSTIASGRWGKGAHTTHIGKTGVELLRY